jgi:hypothetical protein
MTDAPEVTLPSQLWKRLPTDRKVIAAEAFWRDDNAAAEQAEMIATIAHRIKFRTKSVMAMPVEKKARQLVSLPAISEAVAARILVAYHLVHQRPLMGRFLDALGIAHEDGLISDEHLTPPPQERLAVAARTLAASFPAEDVSPYLSTLLWQDSGTWGSLAGLPEVRVTPHPSAV